MEKKGRSNNNQSLPPDIKVSKEKFKKNLEKGYLVEVKNSLRDIEPMYIGAGATTKINANIGASPESSDIKSEVIKAQMAVDSGANAVMDLSLGNSQKDTRSFRKAIISSIDVPVGTVPVYDCFSEGAIEVSSQKIFDVIEQHCKDKVDFITVHCGLTKDLVQKLENSDRLIPITSRGGSFLSQWMLDNDAENPLFSEFEYLLDIASKYDVCLSLGDALRPGTIFDANDYFQNQELRNLGELTKLARKKKVKVIIEGPGHMPLNTIIDNMKLQKKVCDGAPYYVLGPLVTDSALGYDHINSAIGGAIAAAYGADFLCYVTPSEHIGLPSLEDVRKGVIASKIAAHAGDIVKFGDTSEDRKVTEHRRWLEWEKIADYALDDITKKRLMSKKNKDVCSMCGEGCAIKICEDRFLDDDGGVDQVK